MHIDSLNLQLSLRLVSTPKQAASAVTELSRRLGAQPPDVVITISSDADLQSKAARLYSAYFPTRPGFNSDALAINAALPQATSSSTGLDSSAVATDARRRMDAIYSAMSDSGEPFSFDSMENQDVNTLFGAFDRRSLLAVSENRQELFSPAEQAYAKLLMDQQRHLASGQYWGPTSQFSSFKRVETVGETQALAANFLDSVSPEEKATSAWKTNRMLFGGVVLSNVADDSATALSKLITLMSGP